MNKFIVIGALVLLIGAFIIGSSRGSKGDKEDAANENAAIDFLAYKPLETLNGLMSYLALNSHDKNGKLIKWITPVYHLPNENLIQIAKDIYNAKGFFNDDETLTYSALSQLKSLFDLPDLNLWFKSKSVSNGEDLFDYMNSYLNNKEMARCAKLLKALPIMISKTDTTKKIMQP